MSRGDLTEAEWRVLKGLLPIEPENRGRGRPPEQNRSIINGTVVDAYAVKALGLTPVILDWFSNLLRFFLLAPVVGSNPRRAMIAMKGHWWLALGVGLLSPLSYILILAALQNGAPLSLVAPMREMSMMVGALLAMIILRETVGIWRLVGCGVLIMGVIALAGA